MPDEKNPLSDQATQTPAPESPVEADLGTERSAEKMLSQTASDNSSADRYMGATERTEPEREPESLGTARADGEPARNIQPAKPRSPESDAGADLAPRESRDAPQPEGDEPVGQRIGNRSRP